MKNAFFSILTAALALIVALSGVILLFSSCKEVKVVEDPIFESGESRMPLYFYEFMLSLKKGELASAKYDVKSEEFWSTVTETGETYEEYFNREVLESCKNYFAASLIYDRAGFKLSDATLADIDAAIEDSLSLEAFGDEAKFDEIIAEFGVNREELRECCIILAKRYEVVVSIYGADGSLIADSLKNRYYVDNYHRFKQIIYRKSYNEYETDDWGKEIYFDPDTGKPLYDKKNGACDFDDDGNYIKDSKHDCVIYFGEDGKPIYDTEKGVRAATLGEDGMALEYKYSADELLERKSKAEAIASAVGVKNYSYFESELERVAEEEDLGLSYPEGYYVSDIESVTYTKDFDYMNDILALVKSMGVGEVKLFESDYAYHVIMKYPLDDGRFSDGEYKAFFNSFISSITAEMFSLEIEKVMPEITANEGNIAKARSIKDMGINYKIYY